MTILLTILHIAVCIALIAIVLLQSGKGAEMGASFGAGGSQSVFGAGGGTTFLSKLTTGAAIIFMLTSLTLAYLSGQSETSSIMPKGSVAPAPQKPAMPSSAQPTNTPQTPTQSTPAQQQPSPRASEPPPQTK
jgi:preprotein translocase subunit SecG